jgi:hypothetical protein
MNHVQLALIHKKLDRIGEALWGSAWNEDPDEVLAKARELAEKMKEKRDAEIAKALEARVAAGKIDPHLWDAEDEFESQMR